MGVHGALSGIWLLFDASLASPGTWEIAESSQRERVNKTEIPTSCEERDLLCISCIRQEWRILVWDKFYVLTHRVSALWRYSTDQSTHL
ncbi:hypothetical protein QBC33DRAFT_546448 [Phialemonium atrogriseum]|uniref:Secreted protein n=1 Tax=Phialemonium atrogriseum TaxID=1093897 RepID=A0AAJ0BWX5_9PEZI|nr:uncharacterized protein QBC33DRAFT_546448 [Phialemonium atrogriseum]KAK1764572.1 hypothetical protein QBC33DRAFT_546448 [Phialemonium atrogriseum]